MSKNTILVLSQSQIKRIIPLMEIKRVMERVEKAFFSYGQKKVQMPCKTYLYFKKYNGDLRVMPSFASELDMAGTKIVNVHPENPKKGLPTVMAAIILNDAKTGLPVALLDGTYITGMRTGAAGGVASKYLARKDAKTLGVVGAGVQSLFQIVAICQVRKIKEIFVSDINQEQIKWLSKQLKCLNLKIKKASLEEVAHQDILVTVTPSTKPIIKKEWIKSGTHINAIGADAQGKEELDPMILKTGKIFIDDWDQASHSGEINVPFKKGIIKEKDISASFGEVVSGQKPGRTKDNEITIFDSTGLAIQDLFTAELVYQIAKKKGMGQKINLID